MINLLSTILLGAALTTGAAKPARSPIEKVLFESRAKALATEFVLGKELARRDGATTSFARDHRDDCDRPGPACIEVACRALGTNDCDDQSEIEAVAAACRGNHDGGCIESACARLGANDCDDLSEIQQVATMCRGGHGGDCVSTACDLLGANDCDDLSEIEQVTNACRGQRDGECIQSVCARLGWNDCDDLSELEAVARTCAGN